MLKYPFYFKKIHFRFSQKFLREEKNYQKHYGENLETFVKINYGYFLVISNIMFLEFINWNLFNISCITTVSSLTSGVLIYFDSISNAFSYLAYTNAYFLIIFLYHFIGV